MKDKPIETGSELSLKTEKIPSDRVWKGVRYRTGAHSVGQGSRLTPLKKGKTGSQGLNNSGEISSNRERTRP